MVVLAGVSIRLGQLNPACGFMKDFKDKWCLVTGASSGIGEEFCRQLTARQMNLILVARRKERLDALAKELRETHNIRTEVVVSDLSDPTQAIKLFEQVGVLDISVDLLINNAGFGLLETVGNAGPDRISEMIRLNVGSLTELTYRFLPGMLERNSGGIINLASVAGFQPLIHMGVYAATKAFVLHFSESLWSETRDRGVTVLALCPGFTSSEFFDIAGMHGTCRKMAQSPQQVVKACLKGLQRRRQNVVSGWTNYFVSLLPRFVTRRMAVISSGWLMKPKNE